MPGDDIACDLHGRAIIDRSEWGVHISEEFSELTGKKVKPFSVRVGETVLTLFYSETVKLSVPERFGLLVLIRYFKKWHPGFRVSSKYIDIPRSLAHYGLPSCFTEEADAYEAAEVLSTITPLNAEVIASGAGHAVVLSGDFSGLDEWTRLCITGAMQVIDYFHCTRRDKRSLDLDGLGVGEEAFQRASERRYDQQGRIENLLAEVSAKLEWLAGPDAQEGQACQS